MNGYPEDYRGQADIISGLPTDAEVDHKDITPDNRASIKREILKLLDATSPIRLSEAGIKLLNRYATAGFKLIQERMLPPPDLESFLVAYHSHWHNGAHSEQEPGD